MPYYLGRKFGSNETPLFRKEEFAMKRDVIIKAASVLEIDHDGELQIEDESGRW